LLFFSSRRRHTRFSRDWSSDVCSSDLVIFSTVFNIHLFIPVVSIHAKPAMVCNLTGTPAKNAAHIPINPAFGVCVCTMSGFTFQIGRASCREGGEVSVVGRSV